MELILKARKGLVPQKKQITRNGKTYTTTVWVKPNKGEEKTLDNYTKNFFKKIINYYGSLDGKYEWSPHYNEKGLSGLKNAGLITISKEKPKKGDMISVKATDKGKKLVKQFTEKSIGEVKEDLDENAVINQIMENEEDDPGLADSAFDVLISGMHAAGYEDRDIDELLNSGVDYDGLIKKIYRGTTNKQYEKFVNKVQRLAKKNIK